MRPPRERPTPWRAEPPLPLPRAGAPARWCCRSSEADRASPSTPMRRPRSAPPGSPPRAQPASSAGTGDRRSTTSRTPRAGHARPSPSARSRTPRRAPGGGHCRAAPAAPAPRGGTARRTPHSASDIRPRAMLTSLPTKQGITSRPPAEPFRQHGLSIAIAVLLITVSSCSRMCDPATSAMPSCHACSVPHLEPQLRLYWSPHSRIVVSTIARGAA